MSSTANAQEQVAQGATPEEIERAVQRMVGLVNGWSDAGSPVRFTDYAGTAHSLTIQNTDANGRTLQAIGPSGQDQLTIAQAGITSALGVTLGSTLTVRGLTQVVAAGTPTTPALYADPTAVRVTVGTNSPPTATNSGLDVVGKRAYVMPASEELAIGLRYVNTGGSVYLGASNSATPDEIHKNNGATQTMRLTTSGGLIVGQATSTSYALLVQSPAADRLAVTTAGDILCLVNNRGLYGWTSGGASKVLALMNTSDVAVFGNGDTITNVVGDHVDIYADSDEVLRCEAGPSLGAYGHAAVAQQTVTGSRGGNVALANLLDALAAIGFIVDGTSA